MSTDETNGQETPGVRTAKTDEEDTEGHVRTAMGGDAESGDQQPSVRTAVRTADRVEEDDTEGHKFTAVSGDPDFGSRQPSVRTSATADEDDTEGRV